MEESGKTIRDSEPDVPVQLPCSWLCDENDRPIMEYIHEHPAQPFRIRIGAVIYERFGQNAQGESLYRKVI